MQIPRFAPDDSRLMRSFIRAGWQKSDWWLVALLGACLVAGYLFAGMSSHVVNDGMTAADRAAREVVMSGGA